MLYSSARSHMEEKYQWAEESLSIIRHEGSDYGPHKDNEPDVIHGTDLKKLKHALWAFLTAYQQIRFYHGKWQKDNGISGQANKYVDQWKIDRLTSDQTTVWNLLNRFRTADTHEEPIFPDVAIQMKVLGVNGKALTANGKLIGLGRRKTMEVNIDGRYYELTNLVSEGLACMRLFIDTIEHVSLL